jgi:hypothetical protein
VVGRLPQLLLLLLRMRCRQQTSLLRLLQMPRRLPLGSTARDGKWLVQ